MNMDVLSHTHSNFSIPHDVRRTPPLSSVNYPPRKISTVRVRVYQVFVNRVASAAHKIVYFDSS